MGGGGWGMGDGGWGGIRGGIATCKLSWEMGDGILYGIELSGCRGDIGPLRSRFPVELGGGGTP